VLATGNPHKVEELEAIFASCGLTGVRLLSLKQVGIPTAEPAETGTTFGENATIKARSYAAQTGMLCLADDSGLEIDALGGRPGVTSSHYCTDGREVGMSRAERDAANNEQVMREMEGVAVERRGARFVCFMCLSRRDGTILHTTRGTFEGRIGLRGEVPRGENGFGYDPLFLVPPSYRISSAELSPEEKNKLSHRGMAARKMAEFLRRVACSRLL